VIIWWVALYTIQTTQASYLPHPELWTQFHYKEPTNGKLGLNKNISLNYVPMTTTTMLCLILTFLTHLQKNSNNLGKRYVNEPRGVIKI